jgi:hypothetical protein
LSKDTPESLNGIDDYLGICGPDLALRFIEGAIEAGSESETAKPFNPPAVKVGTSANCESRAGAATAIA